MGRKKSQARRTFKMFELHRHDEFSTFDGSGDAKKAAKRAKELGYVALGIANHGNVNGLVRHYVACKEEGIKPILGVEAYFQPVFNKDKRKYHLCLFAKNEIGYFNLNQMISLANRDKFYRTATIDFELLEEFSEGIICSSACVGGPISQAVLNYDKKVATKLVDKFVDIFDDDFYLEIMPFPVIEGNEDSKFHGRDIQKIANKRIMSIADKLDVECIITTDAHYISKKDYPSYVAMHEIANHDVGLTYVNAYMHSESEVEDAMMEMHGMSAEPFLEALNELQSKCEEGYLEYDVELPEFDWDGRDSHDVFVEHVKKGLKSRGKSNKKYIERAKFEIDVISHLGYEDYFLLVEDYVKWARKQDIPVGPGRGSVCNSLVAYALEITDVDSLFFDLDFNRFLRKDKKKLPDIDIDFGTERRQEVIDYLIREHPGRAVQICSYGIWKVSNLVNDLVKLYDDVDNGEVKEIKSLLTKLIEELEDDEVVTYKYLMKNKDLKYYDKRYTDIIKHFANLYGQVRYIGKHAAGVAITAHDINHYVATQRQGGMFKSAYDLNDLDELNVLKVDALGLKTMSIIHELKHMTGDFLKDDTFDDPNVLKEFANANTEGIFQFLSDTAKRILKGLGADSIMDIIAASSLNRPAPLKLGVVDKLIAAKNGEEDYSDTLWYKYTKETYGTIIFQEQVMRICRGLAHMEYSDIDKVMKNLRVGSDDELREKFVKGAMKYSGMSREEAGELFDSMTLYLFNKGHASGYGIISYQQMHFKHYHPLEFWYATLKYETDKIKVYRYMAQAVGNDCPILLPHVNGGSRFSISKLEGEDVIQAGISSIKDIGPAAADAIEKERMSGGDFTSKEDFIERVPKRAVNAKAIRALENEGALEFNRKKFLKRTVEWNSYLYLAAKSKK